MSKLILVPTPIGNLADITLRAIETLKNVDVIAAEDTRHSRKLLNYYHIEKPLVRLDAHTIAERAEAILSAHNQVAFITDAGTPGISDPGEELVALALARGDEVDVLPGATAFVPALVLSGLPTSRFTFEGFLPRKGSSRTKRLEAIAKSSAASIIYESPRRLLATLKQLADLCGETRQASISRELSKQFETTYRGTLGVLLEELSGGEIKGEVVIVLAPLKPAAISSNSFKEQAERLAQEGLSRRDVRKALEVAGAPRNIAYELSLNFAGSNE